LGLKPLGVLAVLLSGGLAIGQVSIQPRRPASPQTAGASHDAALRVDTNLVLVPTAVFDALSRPILGLEKENFKLFDNGVEQPITQFSSEDEPLAAAIVFDVSGSMGHSLGSSRVAARTFFQTANPEDEFCLVLFDSSPKLVIPLTKSVGEVSSEIIFTKSGGSTALLDAIILATHELKKSKLTRKAILIFSDGGENNSRYSFREMRNIARESGALIYAIAIGGNDYDPGYLARLTEDSGGRLLQAGFAEAITKVSLELRNRYLLGFVPSNPARDGKYHKLQVKIVTPRGLKNLRAEWRRGYYSPED
jgi:Ca-activated chloride channel homolog